MPTDPVPPGLIPGRGPGLCPGAGSGLKAHGSSPGMTAAAGGGERRGIRAMAGSFMARFDAGSSGEGLVPPSAAGVWVLAGIQFSGWVLMLVRCMLVRCSAAPRERGVGPVVAARGPWVTPRGSSPRAAAFAGMTGKGRVFGDAARWWTASTEAASTGRSRDIFPRPACPHPDPPPLAGEGSTGERAGVRGPLLLRETGRWGGRVVISERGEATACRGNDGGRGDRGGRISALRPSRRARSALLRMTGFVDATGTSSGRRRPAEPGCGAARASPGSRRGRQRANFAAGDCITRERGEGRAMPRARPAAVDRPDFAQI
jgi:hypothetical protein